MLRRHSRRCSANAASISVSGDAGGRRVSGAGRGKAILFFEVGIEVRVDGLTGISFSVSHWGAEPQLSQLAQPVHLGVSPKWTQIWRWRQFFESTKRAITRLRS